MRLTRSLCVLVAIALVASVALSPTALAAAGGDPTPQPGAAFDPGEFGVPIDSEQQETLSGEWWSVAVGAALGAADAAYTYARSRPFKATSTHYWTGMAASVLVGAGMGALGSATQLGTQTAKATVKVAMSVYSRVRSHVVNEAFSTGLKQFGY